MVRLCKPKEDFTWTKEYPTLDKPFVQVVPFMCNENYAFNEEKIPLYSLCEPKRYVDMVSVFYGDEEHGSTIIQFMPGEFKHYFEVLSYESY